MEPFEHAIIVKGKLRIIFNDTDFAEYRLARPAQDDYLGRWGFYTVSGKTITVEFLGKTSTYQLR